MEKTVAVGRYNMLLKPIFFIWRIAYAESVANPHASSAIGDLLDVCTCADITVHYIGRLPLLYNASILGLGTL